MIRCSKESFFPHNGKNQSYSDLGDLLRRCIDSKRSLVFDFHADEHIEVSVSNNEMSDSIQLHGNVPDVVEFFDELLMIGNVFLPFLLDFQKITIPHNRIYFYGRNDFSLSAFLIRNLSINLIIRSHCVFITKSESSWGSRHLKVSCKSIIGI